MVVDKFGRTTEPAEKRCKTSNLTFGYVLTSDGDIDLENKRICKLKLPIEPTDAASKQYVDQIKTTTTSDFVSYKNETIDLNNKSAYKLKLSLPLEETDATSKLYVDQQIEILQQETRKHFYYNGLKLKALIEEVNNFKKKVK